MIAMSRRSILVGGAAALWVAPASAQDANLYPDAVDPAAAFIRVLVPGGGTARIEGRALATDAAGFTPYLARSAGAVSVGAGDETTSFEMREGMHYTVLAPAAGGLHVVEDIFASSASKADLAFYNASDAAAVDLYVPAAKAAAIAGVASGTGAAVAVRAPLTLDFELRVEDATLAAVSGVPLERKAGVSFVVTGAEGDYDAYAVPNTYGK